MSGAAKRKRGPKKDVTDGELPPPVKHFYNAYAKAFTQGCTTQARTASVAAAHGKGGFLVKDFLVRLSPPCLFPLTPPPPLPPPPRLDRFARRIK